MSEFGWTRLAYLTITLTVLALLVKLGTFGAASISENFPQAALTFSQSESSSEENLDWGNRPKENENLSHEKGEGLSREHPEHSAENTDHEHHSHESVESLYENVNFAEDAPVFYRPTPRVSSDSRNPSSSAGMADKSCQTVGDAPPGSEIIFPVTRDHFDSYEDTWGAARPQGGHEGTDLMIPNGTPLLAMTDARVVPVSGANANGWNTLGGYTTMLEAAYSVGPVEEGDLFYYAHMDERSELRIGDVVEAGDVVGFAGDTGQGPEGARGQFPSHLHLGWYETSGERTQLASGAMNPFPLLEWVKANGGSIEGGSDIPYCEAPQSSAPTPSEGGYWQFPSDPGTRPDMATGTGTATPSPIVEENDSVESSPDITREPTRPDNPNRPANPPRENKPNENEPPREKDPSRETPEPTTPPNATPPSIPIPDIGGGIRDIIDGIINPRPRPERPAEPTTPDTTAPPENTTPDETPGEETTDEETTPETTTPNDEATEEECDPHEHTDGENPEHTDGENPEHETPPNENSREHTDDEECADDAPPDEKEPREESPPEETTPERTSPEQASPEGAVGDQYEDGEEPNAPSDPDTR